jgi:Ca2+-binding EF-hand superfamily protein
VATSQRLAAPAIRRRRDAAEAAIDASPRPAAGTWREPGFTLAAGDRPRPPGMACPLLHRVTEAPLGVPFFSTQPCVRRIDMINRKLSLLAAAVAFGLAAGVNAQTTTTPTTTPPPVTTPPVTTPPDTTPPLGTTSDPMNRESTRHGQVVSEVARQNNERHTPPGQVKEFTELDKNSDGYVYRVDLETGSTLALNFDQYDTDNDGRLSRSEYQAWVAVTTAPPGQTVSAYARGEIKAFADLDSNSDGYVARTDLEAGSPLLAVFDQYDTDNDGRLSRAEYDTWVAFHTSGTARGALSLGEEEEEDDSIDDEFQPDTTLSGTSATSPTGTGSSFASDAQMTHSGVTSTTASTETSAGIDTSESTLAGSTTIDTTPTTDPLGTTASTDPLGTTTITTPTTPTTGSTVGATSSTASTVGQTSSSASTIGATSETAATIGATTTGADTLGSTTADTTTTRTPTDISSGTMASSASETGTEASAFGRETARMAQQQQSFRELDTNNDGFVSRADVEAGSELARRFDEYDLDNDGRLSRTEYESWLAASDASASDVDAVTSFEDDFDADDDDQQ